MNPTDLTRSAPVTAARTPDDDRQGGLAAWQWRLYPTGHRDRHNLMLHLLTVPLFWLGTLAPLLAVLVSPWLAFGLLGLPVALVAQARGHRHEHARPVPFRGPGDFVRRFFVEQWVTFPRYLVTGGLRRAWRER